jgi:hypothetical protein
MTRWFAPSCSCPTALVKPKFRQHFHRAAVRGADKAAFASLDFDRTTIALFICVL